MVHSSKSNKSRCRLHWPVFIRVAGPGTHRCTMWLLLLEEIILSSVIWVLCGILLSIILSFCLVQSSMVARLQWKSHRTELVTAMEPDQSAYYSCHTIWNKSWEENMKGRLSQNSLGILVKWVFDTVLQKIKRNKSHASAPILEVRGQCKMFQFDFECPTMCMLFTEISKLNW